MKTSDVLTSHLISSMERRGDGWGIKNTESRFIYANKSVFLDSALPMNFDIEGRRASECPASWSEYGDIFDKYDEIPLKLGQQIFYISTHKTLKWKEKIFPSFFIKQIAYYNRNKIIGTIFHARKINFELLSKYFFKQPTRPSLLTNHTPNDLFTTEELNVLFFCYEAYE